MTNDKHLNEGHWISMQIGDCPVSLGAPGIAKSDWHKAVAQQLGRHYECYFLVHRHPEECVGFRFPNTEEGYMGLLPDEQLFKARQRPSLLFFEEITNTPSPTQAAALELMRCGVENCLMAAVGNFAHNSADFREISKPMINRLAIYEWEFDVETWESGMRNKGQFPTTPVPIVPDNFMSYQAKHGDMICRFTANMPDIRHQEPQNYDGLTAWPSPRSWYRLSRALAAAESVKSPPHVVDRICAAYVGGVAAQEFHEWIQDKSLPDPEFVLDNPADVDFQRCDTAMAIILSAMGLMERRANDEYAEKAFKLVDHIIGINEELGTYAYGWWSELRPKGFRPLQTERFKQLESSILEARSMMKTTAS